MTDIKTVLMEFSARFNHDLEKFFILPDGADKRTIEAMHYSLMNGGKRLRPFLLCECASLFNVGYQTAFPAAASLEMLHTYSLIHDDLPAMDNDDLRRGKPTCHRHYDEATAILAGDGLLTFAFEVLANALEIRPAQRLALIQLLSSAAGAFGGMVAGQTLDMYAKSSGNKEDDEKTITRLEEMKTGRLLRYACEAGAVLGNADEKNRKILIDYSRKIGQAFQISDDILDLEGNPELVGKTLHKDDKQNKFTFVRYYGVEPARELAEKLIDEAIEQISVFGNKANNLIDLARYITERKY